ncbi:aspartate aminotransferase family protein [Thioclava nitratireducens]|uniref:Aspartate aminotransferase family protein n=1 Tax=Thioclava nitratireducens TaxID=1915078 RepID=A0ABN4X966_9RHOB|nr:MULTISPECIES: aspartate aminotransferase family protein [Thioclava]AQS47670.1 aspartate aminotransferase family protein [Thioclava nitratireducens]OWY10887.1 aspartate aminotransferase family protein [Thioclava sp. F42-5]
MSHVFPRHTKSTAPLAVKGDGIYILDSEGKRYLDGSGGAAVSCLGHSDADVIAAIKDQIDNIAFAHTGFFSSEPAERLADRLIAHAPGSLDRVYFTSGGSEAVESALKMARQYFVEKGEPSRSHFIARRQSYHGNTLGALAAGGNAWRREKFNPLLIDVSHIAPVHEYRWREDGETAEEYGLRVANELEAEIQRLGAENVIGFIAEPVVGATMGAVPPVKGYFKRIREICDQYGILLILDEVMCGMGRTGTLFACEQDGIAPDIVTIAKGLGAGYQPIGAAICTSEIYDAFVNGSGFFQHGHTYIGHPTATAAGDAVVKKLTEGGMVARAAQQGEVLDAALREAFGQHPHIGDIRGRGMFRGLEIVADRATKEPMDPAKAVNKKLKAAAFEAGLVCYPMGGTIDGQRGDHILLAPPFIISDDQIGELVDKLGTAIREVLG